MNNLVLRKIHRWLGVIIGIQILAWTASGLYFSLIPIKEIRGEHLLKPAATFQVRHVKLLSPNELVASNGQLKDLRVDEIQIKQRLNRPAYILTSGEVPEAFDAETGQRLDPLTEAQAINATSARTDLKILSAEWVATVAKDDEYRGGELPAFKVALENGAYVYVGANSGQLRAVRTDAWRLFDLFWALHIMDYEEREDFNHRLLQSAALLSVITVMSGFVLFFSTLRMRRTGRD